MNSAGGGRSGRAVGNKQVMLPTMLPRPSQNHAPYQGSTSGQWACAHPRVDKASGLKGNSDVRQRSWSGTVGGTGVVSRKYCATRESPVCLPETLLYHCPNERQTLVLPSLRICPPNTLQQRAYPLARSVFKRGHPTSADSSTWHPYPRPAAGGTKMWKNSHKCQQERDALTSNQFRFD